MIKFFLNIKLNSFFYLFIIFIIYIIYQFQLYNKIDFTLSPNEQNKSIILWWTDFFKSNSREINCGRFKCVSTENRIYQNDAKVFVFYGSSFNQYDLPLPRKSSQLWAIIHEESPKNLALFLYEDSHKLFNITSTFSRYSNFPLTLQYLPDINVLLDKKYFRTTREKNKLLEHLSPILYIQSDCMTPLERDSYVSELMKYIPVDSYGKCLNNKKLPEPLTMNVLHNLYSDEFMRFVAQYKFVISFENAVCDDYITEKLWRPLIVGSVPIYIGSLTVQDWLPNNSSAILAQNYDNPKTLAEHILKLNTDNELYESYLQHKITGRIDNAMLRKSLSERTWGINEEQTNFFEAFECFVCERLHEDIVKKSTVGNLKHYNCPMPVSPLTRKQNQSNWWIQHWVEGKCQAHVLNKFVNDMKLGNFTKTMFDEEIRNKC